MKLYYTCSENKGADQLHSYCEANLRLCFRLCKLLFFPCRGSINIVLFRCNVCVAEGSDLSGENECGIPCSDDLPCLDCNDEPHGVAELNLCGVCTSPGDTTGNGNTC